MNGEPVTTVRYSEFVVWAAVLVGIPAWAVHLVFTAAMARFVEVHPGWMWTMHLATAVTALATLAGMAICADLLRVAGRPDTHGDDASAAGLTRFLAALGLLVGVSNLMLILLEGSYVIFVRKGRT